MSSLVGQTYPNFEIIAVDDGSTDDSGDKCDEWASRDSRVRVIHKENGGLSDARNIGIDNARGSFVTFVDSDDYVDTCYLSYLLHLFEKADDCLVVGCGHYIDLEGRLSKDYDEEEEYVVFDRLSAYRSALMHGDVNVSAWAKMYSAEVFNRLRYPVGRLYEDTYVFAEVLDSTTVFVFGSEAHYYYCKRSDSIVAGGYDSKRLQFMESVERFAKSASAVYPELEPYCNRRRLHACLSVLRYMKDVSGDDLRVRDEIRARALSVYRSLPPDLKIPKRDAIAVRLLKMGFGFFYGGWSLYNRIR